MKINFTSVTDLKWANPDQTAINCLVDFEDIGVVPHTAKASDPGFPHTEEIFARAIAGEFGTIAEYEAPPQVFKNLTPRQFYLGLFLNFGITEEQIDAYIETLSEPNRTIAKIEKKHASTYERAHDFVVEISEHFGLTPVQVNTAWLMAETI